MVPNARCLVLQMRQAREQPSAASPISGAPARAGSDYSRTMEQRAGLRRRVLIAGGGIAAVETLLALRAAPRGSQLDVTLLAHNERFEYRPLAVLEPFGQAPVRRYPLAEICADHDARLVRGRLASVDGDARAVVTEGGQRLEYDALVVAVGARRRPALEHADSFFGEGGVERMRAIVRELDDRAIRGVAFVVPPDAGWALPLYELALMTAQHARTRGVADAALTLVTPEPAPLAVVDGDGSAAVARVLDRERIHVLTHTGAVAYVGRVLTLDPPGAGPLRVDRVVALPRVDGPAIDGLPSDVGGFVQIDDHCRVPGVPGVYAIGDATTTPVKQGGIATQHADLVAALIARASGPDAIERVRLRAVLLTGEEPLYLQALIEGDRCVASSASREPPWSPPQKIAARYLAPYLAGLAGG